MWQSLRFQSPMLDSETKWQWVWERGTGRHLEAGHAAEEDLVARIQPWVANCCLMLSVEDLKFRE